MHKLETEKLSSYKPAELGDVARQRRRRHLICAVVVGLIVAVGIVVGVAVGLHAAAGHNNDAASGDDTWVEPVLATYRTFRTGPSATTRVAVPATVCSAVEAVRVPLISGRTDPRTEPGVVALSAASLVDPQKMTLVARRYANGTAANAALNPVSSSAMTVKTPLTMLETTIGALEAEGGGFPSWDYTCPSANETASGDFGSLQFCTRGPFNRTVMVVATWSTVVNRTVERTTAGGPWSLQDAAAVPPSTAIWVLQTLHVVLSPKGNVTQGTAPVVLAELAFEPPVDGTDSLLLRRSSATAASDAGDQHWLLFRHASTSTSSATAGSACSRIPSTITTAPPPFQPEFDAVQYTAAEGSQVEWSSPPANVTTALLFAVDGPNSRLVSVVGNNAGTAHWFNASGMAFHTPGQCAFSRWCDFDCQETAFDGRLFVPVGSWLLADKLGANADSAAAIPRAQSPIDTQVFLGMGLTAVGLAPTLVYARKQDTTAFVAARDSVSLMMSGHAGGGGGRSKWFGASVTVGQPEFQTAPLFPLWPLNCTASDLNTWLA